MISSVPIHNSFANDLIWRSHFPTKQENSSSTIVSPEEIYPDTQQGSEDQELDLSPSSPSKNEISHGSLTAPQFIPPKLSTSPIPVTTTKSPPGIHINPIYQQKDLSPHFRQSPPRRSSPYPMKASPTLNSHHQHRTVSPSFHSPNSILSTPSPSFYQKVSPNNSDFYRESTPDSFQSSPTRYLGNPELYRNSPNDANFRFSPNNLSTGASGGGPMRLIQNPQPYPPFSSPISHESTSHRNTSVNIPNDIYRSLNFNNVTKALPNEIQQMSSQLPNPSNEQHALHLSNKTSTTDIHQSPSLNSPSNETSLQFQEDQNVPINFEKRASPPTVSAQNNPCSPPSISNQESQDSMGESRSSTSPVQSLKMVLKKASPNALWSAASNGEFNNTNATGNLTEGPNDVPSLKCYFCSYNTKSRIQLNKHMRDAHNETKILPFHHAHAHANKDSTVLDAPSDDEDNMAAMAGADETHSNLSEDCAMDEYDDDYEDEEELNIDVNKLSENANSNKRNSYKCKKCALTFQNKHEYYVHQREFHIKKEKLLECKLCPFVTEYKHHHEYHIKNHFKMKPFKCSYSNCKYSCNNQSMLNSHVKSHKSFYQFHCKNCNYATKYMHSFKLHLRKNNHEKGITLNEDGSVNNDIIIDIHGTRRGPKRKTRKWDENTIKNINNNNCITETIKKTIHDPTELEFNNNVSMSSNNASSRSNSPFSNAVNLNNNNNNNNESYFLNTKLFVYSQMASMINEHTKSSDVWTKDGLVDMCDKFPLKRSNSMDQDGGDGDDENVDVQEQKNDKRMDMEEAIPLDLSKHIAKKETIIETIPTNEVKNDLIGTQNKNLIKIENKIKNSQHLIRIVNKNNSLMSNNSTKPKVAKNDGKAIKNKRAIFQNENQTGKSSSDGHGQNIERDAHLSEICDSKKLQRNDLNEISVKIDKDDENVHANFKSNPQHFDEHVNVNISNQNGLNSFVRHCDDKETKNVHKDEDIKQSNLVVNAKNENQSCAGTTIKNRRRKGKAYKLQINNLAEPMDEPQSEEDIKCEETLTNQIHRQNGILTEEEQHLNRFNFETLQMSYIKHVQEQYLKSIQQTNNKCMDKCTDFTSQTLPSFNMLNAEIPQNVLSNLRNLNTLNPSLFVDSSHKYQQINNFNSNNETSHLKSLERINAHLFQKSANPLFNLSRNDTFRLIQNERNQQDDLKQSQQFGRKDLFKYQQETIRTNEINNRNNNNNNRIWYRCELCDIQYLDELIYSIHMKYHNVEHPYKCNLCGLQMNNKFQFNLHIIQIPH